MPDDAQEQVGRRRPRAPTPNPTVEDQVHAAARLVEARMVAFIKEIHKDFETTVVGPLKHEVRTLETHVGEVQAQTMTQYSQLSELFSAAQKTTAGDLALIKKQNEDILTRMAEDMKAEAEEAKAKADAALVAKGRAEVLAAQQATHRARIGRWRNALRGPVPAMVGIAGGIGMLIISEYEHGASVTTLGPVVLVLFVVIGVIVFIGYLLGDDGHAGHDLPEADPAAGAHPGRHH